MPRGQKQELRQEFFRRHEALKAVLQEEIPNMGTVMDLAESTEQAHAKLREFYISYIDSLDVYHEVDRVAKARLELSVLDKAYSDIDKQVSTLMHNYSQGAFGEMLTTIDHVSDSDSADTVVKKPESSSSRTRDRKIKRSESYEELIADITDAVSSKLKMKEDHPPFYPGTMSTPLRDRRESVTWKVPEKVPFTSIADRTHGYYGQEDKEEDMTSFTKPKSPAEKTLNSSEYERYIQRVPMPTFNGTGDFESWWSAFEVLIDQSGEPTIIRFIKMKAALEQEPKRLVENFPHTDDAYRKAKERLYDKYGGLVKTINRLYSEINALPDIAEHDFDGLSELLTKVDQTIGKLAHSKRAWELGPGMLTTLLTGKMDLATVVKYNDWRMTHRYDESAYALMWFLEEHISRGHVAMETVKGLKAMKTKRKPASSGAKVMMADKDKKSPAGRSGQGGARMKTRCAMCKKPHALDSCREFGALSVKERWNALKRWNLCFKCMGQHYASTCDIKRQCGIDGCKLTHHKLLHHKKEVTDTSPSGNSEEGVTSDVPSSTSTSMKLESTQLDGGPLIPSLNHEQPSTSSYLTVDEYRRRYVALRTIPVKLISEDSEIEVIALIDEGSTSTYINRHVVEEMKLRGFPFSSRVNTFEGTSVSMNTEIVPITVSGLDGVSVLADYAEVTQDMAQTLDVIDWNDFKHHWPYLKDLPFYKVEKNAKVDLLLGVNFLALIRSIKDIDGKPGQPVARLTPLGWTCAGPPTPGIPSLENEGRSKHTFLTVQTEDTRLRGLLEKFWSWEADPEFRSKPFSKRDKEVDDFVERTAVRGKEGEGYTVHIPWVGFESPEVPCNYEDALRRMYQLEKQLEKEPEIAEQYNAVLLEYLQLGYMIEIRFEKVRSPEGKVWYLPHFAVVRWDKATSKVRPVYDAGAEYMGVSINKMEEAGPKYQQDLPQVLTRFRKYPVGVGCDIARMYMQVKVAEEDQPYQRIVWRWMKKDEPPRIYQFTRVTFGRKSSPYLALKVSQMNADVYEETHPRAVETIRKSTYMDDCLDSVMEPEEGVKLYEDLKTVWKGAAMEPKKWHTNCKELLDKIPESDRATRLDFTKVEQAKDKTLGLWLRIEQDDFGFENSKRGEVSSKRSFLKVIATIFDPLGFVGPFSVRAKIIFQEMWAHGLDWDDKLPPHLQSAVNGWMDDLDHLKEIVIPRVLITTRDSIVELHVLVDAGEEAYGGCMYLIERIQNTEMIIRALLVSSKSKVAPLTSVSIPRLELQGACTGIDIAEKYAETLDVHLNDVHYWSDSMDVLFWVHALSRTYRPYVAHRIGRIQEKSDPTKWKYVPTKLNVADMLTRGASLRTLSSSDEWYHGPAFLRDIPENWPKQPSLEQTASDEKEKKRVCYKFSFAILPKSGATSIFESLPTVRCWARLVRIYSYVRRFVLKARRQDIPDTVVVGPEEYHIAANDLIREAQEIEWEKEKRMLANEKSLPDSSELHHVSGWLDEEGLLRAKTRLENAHELPWDVKYPVVLPRKSPVTDLIMDSVHRLNNHSNPGYTATQYRLKYYTIAAREVARRVCKACLVCRIRKAKPVQPLMGQLPERRVNRGKRVFEDTAVDYAGPYYIKIGRGKAQQKRWICLYTCLQIRAVHIELALDLSTDAFLNAFQRFVMRRGLPSSMTSDNGTNFVAGERELRELRDLICQLDKDVIQAKTTPIGVKWNFLPTGAPHMGGAHEAMIKSMKQALKIIVGKADLNEDELRTAVVMAEGFLNQRPLTYVGTDLDDPAPLTPNHFLQGGCRILITPDGKIKGSDIHRRWRLVQLLSDDLWQRWLKELLPKMSFRSKWRRNVRNLKEDDVVVVIDQTNERGVWPLARVLKTYPGRDGKVRAVDIKMNGKTFRRPVVKLIPLPLDMEE